MQLTFFAEERPANPSPSPGSERDWMILVETSCSPILPLLTVIGPAGWFGRTCPASCRQTEDGILVPSSAGWGNSGMGSPTGFLTLNTSEHTATPERFHNADGVYSLSDILETGAVPQRYYLSARACLGILRRAGKRGKDLPQLLRRALEAVAGSALTSKSTED